MKIAEGFVLRRVGDTHMAVPVGRRTREVHGVVTLSETGATIWRALEGGATEGELVEALLAEYDVDRERAERDVHGFVAELAEKNWLEA